MDKVLEDEVRRIALMTIWGLALKAEEDGRVCGIARHSLEAMRALGGQAARQINQMDKEKAKAECLPTLQEAAQALVDHFEFGYWKRMEEPLRSKVQQLRAALESMEKA